MTPDLIMLKRSSRTLKGPRPPLKRQNATVGDYGARNRALAMARSALYKVNKLSSQAEIKFVATADSSLFVDSTWTSAASDLIQIAQGDTQNTRSGNKVQLKDVECKWYVLPSTTTPTNGAVRFVLFWWKSDTSPSIPDPFISSTVNSFLEPIFSDKVVILYDKTLIMSAANQHGPYGYSGSFKRKLDLPMRFDSTAAIGGETGNLFLYTIADTNGGTNEATLTTNFKVNFTDL